MPANTCSFIRPISDAMPERAWRGHPAFIVGGGTSLRGFDFTRLAGELTIGINAGMYLEPPPTIAYAADIRFMQMVEKEGSWLKLPSMRLVHNVVSEQASTGMLKPETVATTWKLPVGKPRAWGRSLEEGVAAFSFSGAVCLNLADILGASPIYLLGFDCYKTPIASNWHERYPEEWGTAECMYNKFRRTLNALVGQLEGKAFHLRDPDAPPSGADAFPSLSYDDILPPALEPHEIDKRETTDVCIRPVG